MATKKDVEQKDALDVNHLMNRISELERENDMFKQKTPLVGVVWYGDGGIGITLSNMINGVNRLALDSYGEKGVIDYSAWVRLRGSDEVNNGILVRDDSIIDELGVPGLVAKKDKQTNPNAFTDEEGEALLKGKLPILQEFLASITHHFPAKHLMRIAQHLKLDNVAKLDAIRKRYNELFIIFKWALLHYHDLTTACELSGINWENFGTDRKTQHKAMVDALAKIEIKQGVDQEM